MLGQDKKKIKKRRCQKFLLFFMSSEIQFYSRINNIFVRFELLQRIRIFLCINFNSDQLELAFI